MKPDFKLYLITDRKQTTMPLPDAIRFALKGGVRAIQVREKDLPTRELLSLAQELRGITKEFGAKLFINDRADIAVAVDADGVHLTQDSIPADSVRKIVGLKMLIGVSTHNLDEAKKAEADGADFITFGPVFSTPSKIKYGAPAGVGALGIVKRHIRIPVFGLGGIKREDVSDVLRTGADGIALISAIISADDIAQAAHDMVREIA